MRELINDDRVFVPDEHGQRGDVRERGRGRDEHVAAGHRRERILELLVEGHLEVRPRVRELSAEALDGIDCATLQLLPLLQAKIAAAAEVSKLSPAQVDVAPGVLDVICGLHGEACVNRVRHVLLDQRERRTKCQR